MRPLQRPQTKELLGGLLDSPGNGNARLPDFPLNTCGTTCPNSLNPSVKESEMTKAELIRAMRNLPDDADIYVDCVGTAENCYPILNCWVVNEEDSFSAVLNIIIDPNLV